MKRILFPLVLFLIAVPAPAQRSIDLIGWYSRVDLSGDSRIEDLDDFDIDFDSESGYGVGVNVFWSNRLSIQLAAHRFEPQAAGTADDPSIPAFALGELEVIPITAVVQFHLFPNSRIDPYAGAGVAYVLFDQFEHRDDLDQIGVERIDIDDDFGIVFNVGLDVDLSGFFGLNVDVKYVPIDSAARAVFAQGPGTETAIEVNPLIVSAGLSLRF